MIEDYKVGNIIKGKVTGIEKYGIFVGLDTNYSGLIHISEVSQDFVKSISDFVSVGETIYCQILDVNEDTQQLKLSIKNINYKEDEKTNGIHETRRGFLPLKEHIDGWIKEKLELYK